MTLAATDRARKDALRDGGVDVIEVEPDGFGHPDLAETLAAVARRGITRLLIEGGSRLAAAFLRAGLVDRLAWFRAPALIGGDGYPVALPFGVQGLEDMPVYRRESIVALGEDVLETYGRAGADDV